MELEWNWNGTEYTCTHDGMRPTTVLLLGAPLSGILRFTATNQIDKNLCIPGSSWMAFFKIQNLQSHPLSSGRVHATTNLFETPNLIGTVSFFFIRPMNYDDHFFQSSNHVGIKRDRGLPRMSLSLSLSKMFPPASTIQKREIRERSTLEYEMSV
jgi:hypothetical protein